MPNIRPVSDLRNNFTELSKEIHETTEPTFLTKNGYGDMVVMSLDAYENLKLENDIYFKLKEEELDGKNSNKKYTHKEVFDGIKQELREKVNKNAV